MGKLSCEQGDVRVDIFRFHEQRFHCAYVPKDGRVCVCVEGKCLYYFWGIAIFGIEEDGNRFLSSRSFIYL